MSYIETPREMNKIVLPLNVFLHTFEEEYIPHIYLYDEYIYDSMSDLGEIRVYQRADFQSGSRVLKKVF